MFKYLNSAEQLNGFDMYFDLQFQLIRRRSLQDVPLIGYLQLHEVGSLGYLLVI